MEVRGWRGLQRYEYGIWGREEAFYMGILMVCARGLISLHDS